MDLIKKYFNHLTQEQISRFEALKPLYDEWNARINVISRRDMDNFYLHHVLHSLSIARYTRFFEGAHVLDVGTGGGFPGIPLAIYFPNVQFHLVDSIGKKIRVVEEVAHALKLDNVSASQIRAELLPSKYNYIVSRAVTTLPVFAGWIKGKLTSANPPGTTPPGVLYLKGGDITTELVSPIKVTDIVELNRYFNEAFFETKKLVVFQIK